MRRLGSSFVFRVKPQSVLNYVVPMALVSPSLLWIALDKSVWMWDEAWYGKGSVDLFFALFRAPGDWVFQMLHVHQWKAPGISWLGQFFVPLGYLLGSVDIGLLLSILTAQGITLAMVYRFLGKLSGDNQMASITGCLVVSSAPLFVGMSHQYLTEPLQLLAVTWFLLIMSLARNWSRTFVLSQLLVAIPVAVLAKVSSPLYCIGPGLVALWYVATGRLTSSKGEWLRIRVIVPMVAATLLSLTTTSWYYQNFTYVLQHVSAASSGPTAEIYGKKDSFFNSLIYWVGAIQSSFFLPIVLLITGLVFAMGVACYLVRPKALAGHFTGCATIAALQIIVVLGVFSLMSNRDVRYLLPLLPHVALLVGWSLAQIDRPLLYGVIAGLFVVQFASTHGQTLGVIPIGETARWIFPPNRYSGENETRMLKSIVQRTCTKNSPRVYWSIIGVQIPWLNHESAGYVAAKTLGPRNLVGCAYGSVQSVTDSREKIWSWISSAGIQYYVAMDPDLHAVVDDLHGGALNQNSVFMLKKVRNSGVFELETPLAEDPSVVIFRRRESVSH